MSPTDSRRAKHRSVCYTVPRLPFVCDLHHQLAYTNVHGIEKAYHKYRSLFTNGNSSTLAVIITKQLEQPASANDVMKKSEYACLFDNECDQIDGDMITGIVGNVRKFLKLVLVDGVVNDARKIPYVRLHTGSPRLRALLPNIQNEVNNALVQGWPLAKVIEDLVDDVGYALKEYYELNGEPRDHSVPLWARNLFLICLALVVAALLVEWYVVRRKIGVQKSGSIKIASGKSKTHLMF
uniref:Recep_L_domain domain-containing protein n=1 Tax=Caenorhabditis tropicalis TaxID=1561998 RepID=A0A1I7TC02_9PELO